MKTVIFWDIKKISSYLTGKSLLLRYRAQSVNAMQIPFLGYHGGGYEEWRFMELYAVWLL
jgi:hypothetical protein